jgi:hypothetical protein
MTMSDYDRGYRDGALRVVETTREMLTQAITEVEEAWAAVDGEMSSEARTGLDVLQSLLRSNSEVAAKLEEVGS